MPQPPAGPSAATVRRTRAVQARAGHTATAQGDLPAGATQVEDAQNAVTEPDAEALARAQAELIASVNAEPSQEIVALCERIREVIREKRPPDEDALMAAEPAGEALNAGNELNKTVQGETEKVQQNYGPMQAPPEPGAPKQGQDLPPQPSAAETADVNAGAAVPDPVPAENVNLDQDAAASRQRTEAAGMGTAPAQLVQTGPVADARAAQGELDQVAQEGPAQVLARQEGALAQAENNMAALQYQALTALQAARAGTAGGNTAQQGGMIGTEEQMRTRASSSAQTIFTDARNQVTVLLTDLPRDAMAEWDAAKDVLATKFKADLKPVQDRVDERHSGVGGWFVSGWDALTGLPDWAEEGYAKAETAFAEGVIDKLKEISTEVNAVILACDQIIESARTRIHKIFADLPENLRTWAAGEQARFDGQLDQLHAEVQTTRKNFNRDLVRSSSQAVDEVRAEIAALRAKAAGLIGRVIDAVNRFLEDPAKFIIDGLLSLLGISPPAFWALVAKIKKVIADIADDPMRFANNLMAGLAQGFGRFFDNFPKHLLHGFLDWLLGGIKDVQIPKDLSLKSIIGFFLQIMGITWPNIRKILVKLVGEKNVALLERVYEIVSELMEQGVDGIYEMIKDQLDPQGIIDQIIQLAVEYLTEAIIKQVTVRIIAMFNPAGAILAAIEAIYRVLKWVFQNAARIFTLVETVVDGVIDIMAGNIGAVAMAVEKALAQLIAPVIAFIADYLSLGDLPKAVAGKVESMQEWVLGMIERALTWVITKAKALLAKLGFGKKKEEEKKPEPGTEDDQVGDDLDWSVEGESHHTWIAQEGANYVPMMASGTPHPVRNALDVYRDQVVFQQLDAKTAAAANDAIADAAASLDSLEDALNDYETKILGGAKKKDLSTEKQAIKTHQAALRKAMTAAQKSLGLNDEERLKDAKAHFKSNAFPIVHDKGLSGFLGLKKSQAHVTSTRWQSMGVLFISAEDANVYTFDPATAGYRETDPDNREKYGYSNPAKDSALGLEILTLGLRGGIFPPKKTIITATPSEKKDADYHKDHANYKSMISGLTRYRKGFAYPDAILGHGKLGASEHWNTIGHTQTKEENAAWNKTLSTYHGPEHKQESSESGGKSARYKQPVVGLSDDSWFR
ncbi:hypothetical protein AB0F72_17265 [Actinoplanes sp. NPDC023936]|uniref:hypothetical protein n=1 Tax=Actinoplanes sp. NPDC023936 TaxID=3154910 RepID=UPI0033D80011